MEDIETDLKEAQVYCRFPGRKVSWTFLTGANPFVLKYEEIQQGNWKEGSEMEKYREVRTLVRNLEIPTEFAALGASNVFQLHGSLPKDKPALIAALDRIIETVKEDDLREYCKNLPYL